LESVLVSYRLLRNSSAADEAVRGSRTGCARYAPGQDARKLVSTGQGHAQQPSPEPCAQVRILPGALVRGINPNTLTILGRLSARRLTCGNADAFRALPPVRPRNQDPSRGKPSSAANHNDGH
jgi:hypothetical protein